MWTRRPIAGSHGNTIVGDVQVGVYITSRDFTGKAYPVPINNSASGNTIRSNGIYGVLLYNAPDNPVRPFSSSSRFLVKNRFGGQKISSRNYQASFDAGTSLPVRGVKSKHHTKVIHVQHGPAESTANHHPGAAHASHSVPRRVPALLDLKAKR